MATITLVQGTRTQISGASTALNSLASGTYDSIGEINCATNDPLDVLLEVYVTPGTTSGNKQLVVFAKASLDGTNYTTGPESGTTTTDEPNLKFVGTLPLNTASTLQRGIWALAPVFGGVLPARVEVVVKNDSGAALAASGNDAYYAEITGDST